MKVLNVVGARPNFMKIAPIVEEMKGVRDLTSILLHTGQHYDDGMSDVFFRDLGIPIPDVYLGVGSGTHAEQTARIMVEFEKVCLREKPDLVVVVGDVNSTMACAIVAAKLVIPIAHVEAGLRSFDRTMPEEINRLVTDRLADLLLTPSRDADDNLRAEGTPADRIHLVGNVMIDTLHAHLPIARLERVRDRVPVGNGPYAVLTLHRPANVDRPEALGAILDAVCAIAARMPVVFPVHPRTRARLTEFHLDTALDGMILTEPLGYIDFLSLTSHARLILTDSGGLQEESTALGIPCLTLRENTERPVTVTQGTNRVVGTKTADIVAGYREALDGGRQKRVPELWDGHTAGRIRDVLTQALLS